MTKKEIEYWCKTNNYLLINLNEKVPIKKIVRIAERATNVQSIDHKKRRHRTVFARDLAISYLKDLYPQKRLTASIGINIPVFKKVVKKSLLYVTEFTCHCFVNSFTLFKI